MLDRALQEYLSIRLSELSQIPQKIQAASAVHGGSINSCYRLETEIETYFIKTNSATEHPGMFEAEAKGLELVRSVNAFRIPEVILVGEHEGHSFLLMEYIRPSTLLPTFWDDFAIYLAKLHKTTAKNFGLDHDNYIGSLPQHNGPKSDWADFYIENRLMPQEKKARDSSKLDSNISRGFGKLYSRLHNLFPVEKPSLIHGDLWAGNYMVDQTKKPVLIDPAVYFGHREMDIAMSRLFGGFAPEMYRVYQSEFPMENGWEKRVDLCNLYPLMVHVNLFGGSYSLQVKEILSRFA